MYFNIVSQSKEERRAVIAALYAIGYKFSAFTADEANIRYPFSHDPNILLVFEGRSFRKTLHLGHPGYKLTISEFLKFKAPTECIRMGHREAHPYREVVGIGCQLFDQAKLLELAKEIESRRGK